MKKKSRFNEKQIFCLFFALNYYSEEYCIWPLQGSEYPPEARGTFLLPTKGGGGRLALDPQIHVSIPDQNPPQLQGTLYSTL